MFKRYRVRVLFLLTVALLLVWIKMSSSQIVLVDHRASAGSGGWELSLGNSAMLLRLTGSTLTKVHIQAMPWDCSADVTTGGIVCGRPELGDGVTLLGFFCNWQTGPIFAYPDPTSMTASVRVPYLVYIAAPLWFPALLSALVTLRAFAKRRVASQKGLCATCGYDLRGSVGEKCSECGTIIPKGTPRECAAPTAVEIKADTDEKT